MQQRHRAARRGPAVRRGKGQRTLHAFFAHRVGGQRQCAPDPGAQVGDALAAFQKPLGQTPAGGSQGFSSVPAVFEAMPGAFVAAAATGVDAVFQYVITGAGEWHCTIKEGSCSVAAGVHDNPTCTIVKLPSGKVRISSNNG